MSLDQTTPLACSWRRLILMCAITFALVAAASALDQTVAEAIRDMDLDPGVMKSFAVVGIKSLGVYYWSTIAAAIVVALFHRWRWRASVFVLMTGLICLLGNLMKWMVGRTRPFRIESQPGKALPFSLRPFRDGWEGLIEQQNLTFPSGHTMVAFATAAGLAILWPRWRWFFYIAAALVAAQRVVENAHWLSDTVGAAGLAICGVHLMWRIILPWVSAAPGTTSEPQPAVNI